MGPQQQRPNAGEDDGRAVPAFASFLLATIGQDKMREEVEIMSAALAAIINSDLEDKIELQAGTIQEQQQTIGQITRQLDEKDRMIREKDRTIQELRATADRRNGTRSSAT